MKKRIRLLFCSILCAALLLACTATAGAEPARFWPIGDADRDFEITILDVTRIQRYLAGFHSDDPGYSEELYDALFDADGSGEVTILDATCLQRYLADLPCSYRYRELTDYYVGDTSFHSTAEICSPGGDGTREIGYVGVPVTYTALLKWGNPPQTYHFSINGETVYETAANGERVFTVTHTFADEGTYEVQVDAVCKYGVTKTFRRRIDVCSLPEDGRPVVMGAAFFDQTWMSSGNGELTVTAAGGAAPYQYSFTAYYAEAPIFDLPAGDPDASEPAKALVGKMASTGYIDKDTVNPIQLMAHFDCDYHENLYVSVTVHDADGRESGSVTVVCYQYQIYM